jgi:hypothetical protein
LVSLDGHRRKHRIINRRPKKKYLQIIKRLQSITNIYRSQQVRLLGYAAPVKDGKTQPYKLPYLYTPNMPWTSSGNCQLNPELTECGFDVSKCTNVTGTGIGSDNPYHANFCKGHVKLQKIKLTGLEQSTSFGYVFNGCTNLLEVELYGVDNRTDLTSGCYYCTFAGCVKLKRIVGEQLDLTCATSLIRTFANCYSLYYVRFKPFSLSTSIDFGDCHELDLDDDYTHDHPDTLISLVNSITEDHNKTSLMTITLNAALQHLCDQNILGFNNDSNLYFESSSGFDNPISISNAFANKGVTVIWKN